MRYVSRVSEVYVIGKIWQGLECAHVYVIPAGAGIVTRERVARWLDSNAGDFQSIKDFSASIEHGEGTVTVPWRFEESESTFADIMEGA